MEIRHSVGRSIHTHHHILSPLLNQCIRTKNLKATKTLHALLLRTGLLTDLNLHTNLFLSYATCQGTIFFLTNLFKSMDSTDRVPWNALVARFSHHSLPFLALETFSLMHKTGLPLDTYPLCSSLTASASTKMLNFGKQVHAHVSKSGWLASVYVGGSMIDFYVKLSLVKDSAKVFDEIPVKNIICFNTLLSGYAEAKHWPEGLELFHEMRNLSLDPDSYTLSAILRVCVGVSTVALGRQVHAVIIRRIYMDSDGFLLSSLVEMYGKCGQENKARQVFHVAKSGGGGKRDIVLWTSMLNAYGQNGRFDDVIIMYDEMLIEGVKPDAVAFVVVLTACSHTGNVGRGVKYFESMAKDFGMTPHGEHYGCLVDLLCRAGQLEKAWKLLSEMPFRIGDNSSSVSAWGAFLSACEIHGNVRMGKLAAERALELEPKNVGIYVLLSNLYAKCGLWDEIEELRELMKERGLKKEVGCSWIEFTR